MILLYENRVQKEIDGQVVLLVFPNFEAAIFLDQVGDMPVADTPLKPAAAVEPPERDLLLMIAPSAPADPPTPPEPSTGLDDQKISPVEELAQEFTAVTLEIVDKPPDEFLERPKTPRAADTRRSEGLRQKPTEALRRYTP